VSFHFSDQWKEGWMWGGQQTAGCRPEIPVGRQAAKAAVVAAD